MEKFVADELRYIMTNPMVIKDAFSGDLGDLNRIKIHDKPEYELIDVPLLKIPKLENAKQFDITWPFVVMHNLDDIRLEFVCHQIIVVAYRNEPNLNEKLFNLFYTAYLTFQFEANSFLGKKGLDLAVSEFDGIMNVFDWADMASKLRSAYQ